MRLRPYQQQAVATSGGSNVIIKMPTGSGKTLVAAELVRCALERPANHGKRGLFLVPTCDLVEQQARAVRDWCPQLTVKEFMGGATAPTDSFDVLVSTPEAFRRLKMRDSRFAWCTIAICVFDEVHHVLKDHPYRLLAHGLRAEQGAHPQIVGLSASLTYAVGDAAVQRSLQELSRDLYLQHMISVGDEELRAGGYDPPHGEVEIAHPRVLPEGIVPAVERKPHLMHATFFKRIREGKATPFAETLVQVVMGLEGIAAKLVPDFKSPLASPSLKSWEGYAHTLDQRYKYEGTFLWQLETWYVALRLLVNTWEEEQELILSWLRASDAFRVEACPPLQAPDVDNGLVCALHELLRLASNEANLSKVACLKTQLLEKKLIFGEDFRGIVFVEQRITAHILAHYIGEDPELKTAGITADYVAAKDAEITPRIKVSPSAATDCIRRFREGALNVVVATSVIEEGFDVPAANVVISFDHLKNSVELAQRFGRARQAERRIVVMDQRPDRPIARLEEVRREQDALIASFEPAHAEHDMAKDVNAQTQRERGAREVLLGEHGGGHVQQLNLYVKKTKALATEDCRKVDGQFLHIWTYQTVLRNESAEACGATKKDARKACAASLLAKLQAIYI